MDEMKEEDRTAPISEQEVLNSLSTTPEIRLTLLDRLMDELNRKRDAYSGIVSSIRYVIDSKCQEMIAELQMRIYKLLTAYPMRYGGKMFLTKVQARVVSERPLFVEEMYEHILETTPQWSKSFPNQNDILALQILAVKSIKNAEHQRGGRPSKISQQEFDELCYRAIQSCDSSIKIDTFSFIFESRSTTKLLTEKELSLFKILFQAAIGLQEPALRQTFLAVSNRVLKRLKKSHEFVMRDKKLYSPDVKQAITTRYMQFLTWLINYCFDNTYCNAYFGSFIITVSTLKLIILHITYSDKDLAIEPLLKERRCYDSLVSCLADSFEDNKSLALETLLSLPQNEELFTEDTLHSYERIAYELANSVNPAHSLTCQYVFKLVIGLRFKQASNTLSRNQIVISHLCKLAELVEECHKITKDGADLVKTLKHHPSYPKLSCIRVLLQEVDHDQSEADYQDWCNIVRRVVNCSIGCCRDISTIVCNPNPESIGHLPMDLEPIEDPDSFSEQGAESGDSKIVTSQMLLISGWKTIKEASLIFGTLCSKFWWPEVPTKPEKCPSRGIKPILTQELIYEILEFFNYYMKRLRHRGAFEQAYGGFTQVTNRLKYDKIMSQYVLESLNETLNDFKSDHLDHDKAELLRASITRRSGGLPFSIQAKLNLDNDPHAMKSVMNCLYEVIQSPNSDSYKKIHCMNILGALIRQHSQGEKVMPYVGMSFSIAFAAFKSDSYPIRNCANMLLKATVDRTFGVNRLRVDIHRKNQLSFEKFFSECPNLQEQMVRILVDCYNDSSSFAAIHSVFIILFRLCPSLNPNDTFSAEKMILPFIEATRNILFSCTNPQLRTIAAELTVRLENFYYNNTEIEGTHQIISRDYQKLRNNPLSLHGLIMFYKFWIEYHSPNVSDLIITHVVKLTCDISMDKCKKSLSEINCHNQIVEMATIDLIESYAINLPNCVKLVASNRKLPWSESCDHKSREKIVFGHFWLTVMYLNDMNEDDYIIREIFNHWANWNWSINMDAAIIKLFRQLISESECFVDYILEKFDLDLSAALITPYDKLKLNIDNDKRHDVIASFCHQPELARLVRNIIPMKIFEFYNYQFLVKCPTEQFLAKKTNTILMVELLAFALKNWDTFQLDKYLIWEQDCVEPYEKLDYVTKMISNLPDCDVKCLFLLCAGRHMKYIVTHTYTKQDVKNRLHILPFSEILDQLADGDSSVTIRESCVEVLGMLLMPTLKLKDRSLQPVLVNLFSALIKLSQDENSNVRRSSDMIITSFSPNISFDQNNAQGEEISLGSRLDHLIKILTTEVFNSEIAEDLNNCFNLLMRIIFNHSKNYSHNLIDQKERLFDKTKLNTFADFVSIIENTLAELEKFFKKSCELQKVDKNLIHVRYLKFSNELIEEFKVVDTPKPSDKGDYSWRLTKITSDFSNLNTDSSSAPISDNQALMKSFLQNIIESLDYFASGYSNVLLDTEYIYHELSLFKRLSFLMFLVKFTDYELRISGMLSEIKKKLDQITSKSCCTTLLNKCSRLIGS